MKFNKTIESLLRKVSFESRLALTRFINGDCVDVEVLEALKELAKVEKQANYEELMAEMFDDVLK